MITLSPRETVIASAAKQSRAHWADSLEIASSRDALLAMTSLAIKALGLAIPEAMLDLADKVIE